MSDLRSRHAFGSEANVDSALEQGKIDALDVLFLDEGKIGWIDKNGNKVILENAKQVIPVDELPETGISTAIYICNGKFYYWDETGFKSPASEGGVDESTVNTKVEEAVASANAYTDEQIANAVTVVEF